METKPAWEQKAEWTHSTVRATRRGWLVEIDSRIQGTRTGLRVSIPYGATIEGLHTAPERSADLYATCNDHGLTLGEWLERAAIEGCGRVLSHGLLVA